VNNLKPRLQNIMERHSGRQQTITRRDLRQVLELDIKQDRKLRLVISELRRGGFQIMFATEKPAGYYLPSNLAELNEGKRIMKSYVIDLCITMAAFKTKGAQYIAGDTQGKLL